MMKMMLVCLLAAFALSPAVAKPQVLVDYGYSSYYAAPAYVSPYSAVAYSYPYAYTYSYPYAYY